MSFNGLVDYLSSSEEDDEIYCSTPKRLCLSEKDEGNTNLETSKPVVQNKLPPLPASFLAKFEAKKDGEDDPSAHGGRIRSFKHELGNWATFVSVIYPHDLTEILGQVTSRLSHIAKFSHVENPHLTVSRTVTIYHHWIDNLVDELKKAISQMNCKKCRLKLRNAQVYCNDEKTRTFIGLEVSHEELHKYVRAVDKSFNEFRLPLFYKNPSFHISLVWCVGDKTSELNSSVLSQLTDMFEEYFMENAEAAYFEASELRMKTGNKTFRFELPTII